MLTEAIRQTLDKEAEPTVNEEGREVVSLPGLAPSEILGKALGRKEKPVSLEQEAPKEILTEKPTQNLVKEAEPTVDEEGREVVSLPGLNTDGATILHTEQIESNKDVEPVALSKPAVSIQKLPEPVLLQKPAVSIQKPTKPVFKKKLNFVKNGGFEKTVHETPFTGQIVSW